ncbi:MAG: dihydrodipicolinate synthase family protein [Chitinophagales bacterium]
MSVVPSQPGGTRRGLTREEFRRKAYGKIFPAVPVPWTADGRIHREAQEAYVRHMAGEDLGGVAVWAHTGRGLHLTGEQRREVLASWRRGLPDDRLVIAGAGALPNPALPENARFRRFEDEAVRMAEEALEGGADALLMYAPVIYRDLPDQDERIVGYHQRLASLGAPLVLFYLYREAGGISYSPQVLEALLSLPQTVGIKVATLDSVMTYQDISRLIQEKFPDVTLITGEDRMLGYTVMRGGVSALIGMGSAFSRPQAELLRCYLEGRAERFLELSNQVDAFAEATFIAPMEKYILRMLWALVIQGVIPEEAAHDVLGLTVPKGEVEALAAVVRRLGWI